MTFLKPLGKAGSNPMGCICSTGDAHKSSRGGGEIVPCSHCGCSCGSDKVRVGNRMKAAKSGTTW